MTAPAACRMTVEALQNRLRKDPIAVERALQTLYYHQTAAEQAAGQTVEDNGVGFNGVDAEFLSSLAQWVIASRREPGKKLTPKQFEKARKCITKYAAQLLRLSGVPVRHEPKKGKKDLGQKAMEAEVIMHNMERGN